MANFLFISGCSEQIALAESPADNGGLFKPAPPIDAGNCSTRALRDAKTYADALRICKACPFGLRQPTGPQEPPRAAPAASPERGPIEQGTPIADPQGSAIVAGFVPVDAHPEELEPIPAEGETILGDTPPPSIPAVAEIETEAPQALPSRIIDTGTMPFQIAASEMPPLVEDLLRERCPWIVSGGSLMGWSKLKIAKICLRYFFWDVVMGLRRKRRLPDAPAGTAGAASADGNEAVDSRPARVNALDLGTLIHACIETFYRTGDPAKMWLPADAVKHVYPELALETRRLVNFYLRRYNKIEAATWDMRSVERESRYYFPARKCAGRRRSLCVSCRHDGIYRPIKPGQARLPPGLPAPDGVNIHELKSTQTLTSARLRGFFQNAQVMMNLLCYNHGHAVKKAGTVLVASNADLIGPADVVMVTHIGKPKRMDVNKDIERTPYAIPESRVLAFRDDLADWYYEEIADRLFNENCDDLATWRKDWLCQDVFFSGWTCPFVPLCEAIGATTEELYEKSRGPLDPETLEMPKELAKAEKAKAKAAAVVEAK